MRHVGHVFDDLQREGQAAHVRRGWEPAQEAVVIAFPESQSGAAAVKGDAGDQYAVYVSGGYDRRADGRFRNAEGARLKFWLAGRQLCGNESVRLYDRNHHSLTLAPAFREDCRGLYFLRQRHVKHDRPTIPKSRHGAGMLGDCGAHLSAFRRRQGCSSSQAQFTQLRFGEHGLLFGDDSAR